MAAHILDGKEETGRVLAEVADNVALLARHGKKARLVAIQANTDPGTDWYARAQAKHCANNGIEYDHVQLPADADQATLLSTITAQSNNPAVSGIMLFTPLPAGVNHAALAEAIAYEKDAEGVHPFNLGRLLIAGSVIPSPCTAQAALELIRSAMQHMGREIAGSRALVIGRSATVGKPLALMLIAEHATVTVAHTRSDLRTLMLDADIVVAAAGASGARWRAYERAYTNWKEGSCAKPERICLEPLVTVDMVRRGAVVIDVGDNNVPVDLLPDGSPVLDDKGQPKMQYSGDVDFDKVGDVAGYITKPRGSVGPLTNAFLLRNVARAALRANNLLDANA